MKLFIMVLLLGSITARAQKVHKPEKPESLNLYLKPNPDIIDTAGIKKLNDKFYTGNARQDRMPVLLPYGTGKSIANAGAGMSGTGRMPNLWSKPQKNSAVRDSSLRKDQHPLPALPHRGTPGRDASHSK